MELSVIFLATVCESTIIQITLKFFNYEPQIGKKLAGWQNKYKRSYKIRWAII